MTARFSGLDTSPGRRLDDQLQAVSKQRVAAVVVAWNRGARIAESIDALLDQSRPVDEIILVDNGSDDETVAFARARFPSITIVQSLDNLGHAGGAELGIKAAFENGHDWFWMFDDDAYPNHRALESALSFAETIDKSQLGFLYIPSCDLTGWMWDGRKQPVSLREMTKGAIKPYKVCIVDFNMTLVSRKVVDVVGLPRDDYFMMMWEPEYCLRARDARIYAWVVPEILIRHEHAGFAKQAVWRSYYQTRNHVALVLQRRSPKEAWWCAIRQFRFIAGTILRHERKFQRITMRLRGIFDGLLGRMGRRIDPSQFR